MNKKTSKKSKIRLFFCDMLDNLLFDLTDNFALDYFIELVLSELTIVLVMLILGIQLPLKALALYMAFSITAILRTIVIVKDAIFCITQLREFRKNKVPAPNDDYDFENMTVRRIIFEAILKLFAFILFLRLIFSVTSLLFILLEIT